MNNVLLTAVYHVGVEQGKTFHPYSVALFSFQHVPTFAVTYQRRGWGPSLSCHPTKHQQWFFCVSVAKCRGKKAQRASQSVDGGSE